MTANQQISNLISGLVILGLILPVYGQELSREELENKALEAFEKKDYATAIEAYENLYMHYERDAAFNYYLGRSYLHHNSEPKKAARLLKYAASQSYNEDVHFYLGQVYYKNYDFENATIAYKNFEKLTKKSQQKKYNLAFWLEALEQLQSEMEAVQPVIVTDKEKLPINLLESSYARQTPGKLIYKPEQFMNRKDKETSFQSIMYLPPEIEIGDYLYVCSMPEKGKNGKNIYQIKRLNAADYRFPTLMGDGISTSFNEEYPYYDEYSKTLYFASDRPGGCGGYDIYRSEYDELTHQFQKPERLPFPINTPFDDILYIPDSTGTYAIFSSNRECSGSDFISYKHEINPSLAYVFPGTTDEIASLANFSYQYEPEIAINQLSPARTSPQVNEYQKQLGEALEMQLKCDSMNAELHRLKNLLRAKDNVTERKVLIADITLLESRYKELQSVTDDMFLKVEELKPGYSGERETELLINNKDQITSPGSGSQVVISSDSNKEITSEKLSEKSKTVREKGVKTGIAIAQFEILKISPYSKSNPIPTDVELPNGLVYRIQLGVFTHEVPMDTFGGLTPVTAEESDNGAVRKFYVGYFETSKDAKKALEQVKSYGFTDAFIVPYYDKQKIAIGKAREIEFAGR